MWVTRTGEQARAVTGVLAALLMAACEAPAPAGDLAAAGRHDQGGGAHAGTADAHAQHAIAGTAPQAAVAPALPSALSPAAAQALGESLQAYEELRAQLAADKTDGLEALAARIETGALAVVGEAPGPVGDHARSVATAASALKAVPTLELAEARRVFGEISKAMVGLVQAEPSLSASRHVFECPMASGYKKWVQLNETISNPYMGTKMATCGVKSTWME